MLLTWLLLVIFTSPNAYLSGSFTFTRACVLRAAFLTPFFSLIFPSFFFYYHNLP